MSPNDTSDREARQKALGHQLRDARKAAGLKQEEVAERIGVSPISVSRWERGAQEIKMRDFRAFMDVVGVKEWGLELYEAKSSASEPETDESITTAAFSFAERKRLLQLEIFALQVRELLEQLGESGVVKVPGGFVYDPIRAAQQSAAPMGARAAEPAAPYGGIDARTDAPPAEGDEQTPAAKKRRPR